LHQHPGEVLLLLELFWYFWLLKTAMEAKAVNLFVSSVLLVLGLSVTSFARVGETMYEAIRRYGNVVRHATIEGEELYSFNKNGFIVIAHFYDGKIDHIMYGKPSGEKLTPEEIDTFLKANNSGRPMEEALRHLWVGKNVSATYSKDGKYWHLNIKTLDYEHQQIAADEAAEKAEKKAEEAEEAALQAF
jgi:hypothetical protein